MGRPRGNDTIRFWAKVEVKSPDECWLWLGSKSGGGYGQFFLNGSKTGAHRASYILHYGPIPDGLDVLHTCDVPLCVNPAHLRLGTHTDNMHDMTAKGRAVALFGEAVPTSKLTDERVLEIFELRKQGLTCREIGKYVQVSGVMVSLILRRKFWKHIQP